MSDTMPYWNTPEFHAKLEEVPFVQEVNGQKVVNVVDSFFRREQGQLVMARVPEDLSMPTEWEAVPDSHPWRAKAISMLG